MAAVSGLNREVFVYRTVVDGRERDLVSLLEPGWVFERGLPAEGILGALRTVGAGMAGITPEQFQENGFFIQFLHDLLAEQLYQDAQMRRAAQQQGDGYVYLIDARTRHPDAEVPAQDIIGAVTVEAGSLVPGSYRGNPNHRLLTDDGFFLLPPELETVLQSRIRSGAAATGSPADPSAPPSPDPRS